MILTLYRSGLVAYKDNWKLLSKSGLMAIIVYTLNEGLRFGRGPDYIGYWLSYERSELGQSSSNLLFNALNYVLSVFDLPFQWMIVVFSFTFIISVIILCRDFKDIYPYVLPLFCLFSLIDVENMIRWYWAFSFFLIALHFLVKQYKSIKKYVLFSVLACMCHIAFIPIPFIVLFLVKLQKPLMSPVVSIIVFFGIGLFVDTSAFAYFSSFFGKLGDLKIFSYYSRYAENAEYWLTSGYGGAQTHAFPHISEIIFSIVLLMVGYHLSKKMEPRYAIFYNFFLIGFILYPIANQVELSRRYIMLFYFFRAFILAYIVKYVIINRKFHIQSYLYSCLVIVFALYILKPFVRPIFDYTERRYMYIWNKNNETPDKMFNIWSQDVHR